MALAHNKSFAVVPCCVFPSKFPRRMQMPRNEPQQEDDDDADDGDVDEQEVRSYASFVKYLEAKDVSIETSVVEGLGPRNIVLYRFV